MKKFVLSAIFKYDSNSSRYFFSIWDDKIESFFKENLEKLSTNNIYSGALIIQIPSYKIGAAYINKEGRQNTFYLDLSDYEVKQIKE